jgi:glucose/arabinose dehydrogenase
MRINPDGSGLELVAWGLRNPWDIRFGPDGQLYATDNGYDTRGSRPIEGADLFRAIQPGAWYGWPDYWNGRPVTELSTSGREKPRLLLAKPPAPPAKGAVELPLHGAAAGFDFAPASFGFGGQAFIALWGSGFPATAQTPTLNGFRVIRLDPHTGKYETFAINKQPGPASMTKGGGGFERPVVTRFGPDGALYVLEFGHMAVTRKGPYQVPDGGVLWRISRNGTQPAHFERALPVTTGAVPPGGSLPGPDLLIAAGILALSGFVLWRDRRGKKSFRAS